MSDSAEDSIHQLHINGMRGRLLRLDAKKGHKREFLVVYGHHSSLERWWGLAQALNDYGAVMMPDLPGFGGMDSFYTIGKKPTLDTYADYLAAYVQMRYKHRRVTLVGISFGFLVVTRMLQRYPELTKKVDMLISAVGFMHADNFLFTPQRHQAYVLSSRLFAIQPFAYIFRTIALNRFVLRMAYAHTHNAKVKFAQANGDRQKFEAMMDMEIALWHTNDMRTHFRTTVEMLTVDNCGTQVDLPVWHVYTPNDNYFDNAVIEQQMQVVFASYNPIQVETAGHAPSVIATKEEAAMLLPKKLCRVLKMSPKRKM